MVMLGSLVWDDTNVAHWAAMSANATLGFNEAMINSLLSMRDGDEEVLNEHEITYDIAAGV